MRDRKISGAIGNDRNLVLPKKFRSRSVAPGNGSRAHCANFGNGFVVKKRAESDKIVLSATDRYRPLPTVTDRYRTLQNIAA
eukprot:2269318-Pyramimonas_sp.AAC.1